MSVGSATDVRGDHQVSTLDDRNAVVAAAGDRLSEVHTVALTSRHSVEIAHRYRRKQLVVLW
jgi:hypothetical protein